MARFTIMNFIPGALLCLAAVTLLTLQIDDTYLWVVGPPSRSELRVAGGNLAEVTDCHRSSHETTLTIRTGKELRSFSIRCPDASGLAALRADADQVALVSYRTRVLTLPFFASNDVWDLWTPNTHLIVYERRVASHLSTRWLGGLILAATLILGWLVVRSDIRKARREGSASNAAASE